METTLKHQDHQDPAVQTRQAFLTPFQEATNNGWLEADFTLTYIMHECQWMQRINAKLNNKSCIPWRTLLHGGFFHPPCRWENWIPVPAWQNKLCWRETCVDRVSWRDIEDPLCRSSAASEWTLTVHVNSGRRVNKTSDLLLLEAFNCLGGSQLANN